MTGDTKLCVVVFTMLSVIYTYVMQSYDDKIPTQTIPAINS